MPVGSPSAPLLNQQDKIGLSRKNTTGNTDIKKKGRLSGVIDYVRRQVPTQ
jgi:hypothetical protein